MQASQRHQKKCFGFINGVFIGRELAAVQAGARRPLILAAMRVTETRSERGYPQPQQPRVPIMTRVSRHATPCRNAAAGYSRAPEAVSNCGGANALVRVGRDFQPVMVYNPKRYNLSGGSAQHAT